MFDTNEDGGVEYWGSGNWQDPNIRVSVIALSAGPNKIVDGSAVNSSKCDDIFSWRWSGRKGSMALDLLRKLTP